MVLTALRASRLWHVWALGVLCPQPFAEVFHLPLPGHKDQDRARRQPIMYLHHLVDNILQPEPEKFFSNMRAMPQAELKRQVKDLSLLRGVCKHPKMESLHGMAQSIGWEAPERRGRTLPNAAPA